MALLNPAEVVWVTLSLLWNVHIYNLRIWSRKLHECCNFSTKDVTVNISTTKTTDPGAFSHLLLHFVQKRNNQMQPKKMIKTKNKETDIRGEKLECSSHFVLEDGRVHHPHCPVLVSSGCPIRTRLPPGLIWPAALCEWQCRNCLETIISPSAGRGAATSSTLINLTNRI